MRYLLVILLCSCTTTKNYILDGSKSQGNIVKYEWNIDGSRLRGISTSVETKKKITVQLIVTDDKGRKDTATTIIK